MITTLIKKLLPKKIKEYIKNRTLREKIITILAKTLPEILCIDVGASYYPHTRWGVLLGSNKTTWIAVEPNASNLNYLSVWPYASNPKSVTTGLSQHGGDQILFITNVDSGSSLLEPKIKSGMRHRINAEEEAYYFPFHTKIINTKTLSELLRNEDRGAPIFVKLDTQGTELSILRGACDYLDNKRIVGVELESTLLAEPIMQGAGKFHEAYEYLEGYGFELLDIKIIRAGSLSEVRRSKGRQYINECDAVFALRRDVAEKLPTSYRIALLAFYVSNEFYEEAYMLVRDDETVRSYLNSEHVYAEKFMTDLIKLA